VTDTTGRILPLHNYELRALGIEPISLLCLRCGLDLATWEKDRHVGVDVVVRTIREHEAAAHPPLPPMTRREQQDARSR